MSKRSIIVLGVLLYTLSLVGLPAAAAPGAVPILLHLRRATFDPLVSTPAAAPELQASPRSRLMVVQFSTAPDERIRAQLEASGLHPLLYIPDNALLVRTTYANQQLPATLPNLRWSSPFQLSYKLPPELDPLLQAGGAGWHDLRLLAAPDADLGTLTRDLLARGGAILGSNSGLNGTSLRVQLPASALRAILARDDVLWVEPFIAPHLHNDLARQILGVPAAREQLGLTGAGQIVAVTDTGLDVQANLSADFAGRVAAGFTRQQMDGSCTGQPYSTTWDDRNGHGTHVAGTILGSGALSPAGFSFAGIAPQARVVVQAVSNGGTTLDCLPFDTSYLSKAYDAGARIQNASWGGPTGWTDSYGGYTQQDQDVDTFLWQHKDHLFVVSAGNSGTDSTPRDGVVDRDSINTPGTAKNVLTVGASESTRSSGGYNPGGRCSTWGTCWPNSFAAVPLNADRLSDNPNGIAAFSSRGPTNDGRIKPEIVAPGTNILSARSHDPAAGTGWGAYNADYAYNGGTSMAAPMVSGLAALVRQWLAQVHGVSAPSAALVKALLLNGAIDIGPGQYGVGPQREIPAAWPNNVEGWGRAAITDTVGLNGDDQIWLREGAGLTSGAVVSYTLRVDAGQLLRITLAWTDYPGAPLASKALVNDLDLEVQTPDGALLRGNASAELVPECRVAGADRCNNVESVQLAAPSAGVYIVSVRGAVVSPLGGPQPFALVARAQRIVDPSVPPAPTLDPIINGGEPTIALTWSSLSSATSYLLQESTDANFTTIKATFVTTNTQLTIVEDEGHYYFRVRGCNGSGCGPFSAVRAATVIARPWKVFAPLIVR